MGKITTSDFQKGMFIEFKGDIHQISEFQHVNPGKGSAFVRTKLKNVKSGNSIEFTYKSGESVEQISVYVKDMQFLYKLDNNFNFMDSTSFEQIIISEGIIGDVGKYLKDGENYQIFVHENQGIGIKAPKKVKLKVTEADEGAKGNTVSGAKKSVRVETGVTVMVPLFIKKGDVIAVSPETGEYLERVNG